MKEYFAGRSAVVTGAASGFGLGIATRLLQYGARAVYMADRNGFLLEKEAGRLSGLYPGKVFAQVTDVTKHEEVSALISRAARESGGLDLLFNNAGRPLTKPTERIDPEEFFSLVQVNYLGTVYGVLAALKVMLPQKSGHIINTASMGGLVPAPFQSAYASSKAAVITLTRSLAYEYANTGVYFTQFSPGNVATPIFKAERAEALRHTGKTDEEVAALTDGIRPPEGAMPLDTALDTFFDGIARRQTDVLCWEQDIDPVGIFYSDRALFDASMLELAQKRRAYYEACDQAALLGVAPPPFPV